MRLLSYLFVLLLSINGNTQYKSQLEISKNYTNGNYVVYRNDLGKLDKVGKLWPLTINRSSDGLIESVLIKRSGVIDEEFKPDLKEQPGYFFYDDARLMFLESYAVYYKQKLGSDGSAVYDVMYEFIPDGGSSRSLKDVPADIAAYRAATLNNQSTARADIAKNKEAAEAKEREENSTKGKNIKSLTFKAVEVPANLGHYSKIEFGVIATLQDGKELKTKNIGGKTDFEFSYDISAPGCTFANGMLDVSDDASQFPNDEIVITIKNLHNPSQSIQQKFTLTYNVPINFSFIGSSGNSGSSGNNGGSNNCNGKPGSNGSVGENGKDFNIKIAESKHKKTGATLYTVEITKSGDNKIYKLKLDRSAQINITTKGGVGGSGGSGGRPCSNGGIGGSGGNGGTGGRGGNINIVKSSNAIPASLFNISNNGGAGGKGGNGHSGSFTGANGRNGDDGRVDVQISPVKLTW